MPAHTTQVPSVQRAAHECPAGDRVDVAAEGVIADGSVRGLLR